MSQSELAGKAGVTRAAINGVLSGARNPGPDLCNGIARAFHIPPTLVFEKAGLLPLSSDLSPKKRELMQRLETADEATVQMVIKMLEAAVEAQHRQVPSNLNPKTTPR